MSQRSPGEPGRYLPAGNAVCSYDGGDNGAPVCGQPAVLHLYAGSAETGPGDFSMTACEDHANTATALAWDWHPFGGVCDMPGTTWQSKSMQGEGFCYWPEVESAMHEQLHAPQEVHA